jgi:hypothetical protein
MVSRRGRVKPKLPSVGRNRVRQDTHPVLQVALALDCGPSVRGSPSRPPVEVLHGGDGPDDRKLHRWTGPGSCLTLLQILKEVVDE